jgi:prepilin-type N-terminal cleavage/methylation domain-containing protein
LRHIYRIFHRSSWGKQSKKRKFLRHLCIAGFTLLELAIVIQIIGLLAVIVLSNFYKSKKAAEVAVVVQNIKNVQTALTSYLAMAGKYPDTLNPIWLQFYAGNVVEDVEYIGGATASNQGGWNFFASHSPDIRFSGIGFDEYALKSKDNLLPYALYIYGDVSTVAKVVH